MDQGVLLVSTHPRRALSSEQQVLCLPRLSSQRRMYLRHR
jgi:hypothetical protein